MNDQRFAADVDFVHRMGTKYVPDLARDFSRAAETADDINCEAHNSFGEAQSAWDGLVLELRGAMIDTRDALQDTSRALVDAGKAFIDADTGNFAMLRDINHDLYTGHGQGHRSPDRGNRRVCPRTRDG